MGKTSFKLALILLLGLVFPLYFLNNYVQTSPKRVETDDLLITTSGWVDFDTSVAITEHPFTFTETDPELERLFITHASCKEDQV